MTRKQKRLAVIAGGMSFIIAAVLLMMFAFGQDRSIGRHFALLSHVDESVVVRSVKNDQRFDSMRLKVENIDTRPNLFAETNDRWNFDFDEELSRPFVNKWNFDDAKTRRSTDRQRRDDPSGDDVRHGASKLNASVRIRKLLMPHEIQLQLSFPIRPKTKVQRCEIVFVDDHRLVT